MRASQLISCDGTLIWDYSRGEVICSSTGEVIDRIYVYGPCRRADEDDIIAQQSFRRIKAGTLDTRSLMRRYRRKIKMYKKALALIKDKPWLEVNMDKVFRQKKFIQTIYSKNTLKALRNVETLGINETLQKILSLIEEIEPAALARTERSKLALAFIVHKMISKEKIDPNEVTSIFNISVTTFKRLERIARRVVKRIEAVNIVMVKS